MRECCPYREAKLQGRLWTPELKSTIVSLSSSAPTADVFLSQPNLGGVYGDTYGYFDNASWSHTAFGQTFTPAADYFLHKITIVMGGEINWNPVGWDLYVISNPTFDANKLVTYTTLLYEPIYGSYTGSGYYITFTLSKPQFLLSGNVYGFILNSLFEYAGFYSDNSNPYAGGVELMGDFGGGTFSVKPASNSNMYDVTHYSGATNYDMTFWLQGTSIYSGYRAEGYSAWDAGLQSYLDASHLFKNRPPLIGD